MQYAVNLLAAEIPAVERDLDIALRGVASLGLDFAKLHAKGALLGRAYVVLLAAESPGEPSLADLAFAGNEQLSLEHPPSAGRGQVAHIGEKSWDATS